MKATAGPGRVPGKAKSKARRTTGASKARKSATRSRSPSTAGASGAPASRLIDERIRDLAGWRGETLARMRALILEADPGMTEELKWMGTPVWSHHGIVCTGEAYTKAVKLTFARGARLPDPSRLFNSSLDGNTRRAIDIHEGEKVDAGAFKALVTAAVSHNRSTAKSDKARAPAKAGAKAGPGAKARPAASEARPARKREGGKVGVVLLSGGNPQIAKGDGDPPVQAYIAAMPGWKREVGNRLDALIVRSVPNVRKAVRWNSPMYGIGGQGWFLALHVFTHYVKVTFFRGTSLRPVPPGGTGRDARWIDIHEDDLDEAQMTTWVKQAAALPGWVPGRPS
jgi:hypothetical protein